MCNPLNKAEQSNIESSASTLSKALSDLNKVKAKRHGKRGINIEKAFAEIRQASLCGDEALEQLIFKRNTPPSLSDNIDELHSAWIEISHDIFNLNPKFSPNFVPGLLGACISKSTNPTYCISHSDVIAVLISNNPSAICMEKCADTISKAEDSRALYAIKALQFYLPWEHISHVVFNSFISSEYKPKKNFAYWLLNQRATAEELISFSSQRGFELPSEVIESLDKSLILKTIYNLKKRSN